VLRESLAHPNVINGMAKNTYPPPELLLETLLMVA
jgi:hypothetical protein